MISSPPLPSELLSTLLGRDGFLVGIPCSFLGELLDYAEQSPSVKLVIPPDEAQALAFAAGLRLANQPVLAFLQNSGIGACIDPITSILKPFNLDLELLVSHRGHPDIDDAPHHLDLGLSGHKILKAIGVDVTSWEDARIESLQNRQRRTTVSAIFALPGKCVRRYRSDHQHARRLSSWYPIEKRNVTSRLPMFRDGREAIKLLLGSMGEDEILVAGVGLSSRLVHSVRDRPTNLYLEGGMGLVPAFAAGMALALPERKIVAVQGDAATSMHLASLPFLGHLKLPNFHFVILDNEKMLSTGGQCQVASPLNYLQLGEAVGLTPIMPQPGQGKEEFINAALREHGPTLTHCRIGLDKMPSRVSVTPTMQVQRFRQKLCQRSFGPGTVPA